MIPHEDRVRSLECRLRTLQNLPPFEQGRVHLPGAVVSKPRKSTRVTRSASKSSKLNGSKSHVRVSGCDISSRVREHTPHGGEPTVLEQTSSASLNMLDSSARTDATCGNKGHEKHSFPLKGTHTTDPYASASFPPASRASPPQKQQTSELSFRDSFFAPRCSQGSVPPPLSCPPEPSAEWTLGVTQKLLRHSTDASNGTREKGWVCGGTDRSPSDQPGTSSGSTVEKKANASWSKWEKRSTGTHTPTCYSHTKFSRTSVPTGKKSTESKKEEVAERWRGERLPFEAERAKWAMKEVLAIPSTRIPLEKRMDETSNNKNTKKMPATGTNPAPPTHASKGVTREAIHHLTDHDLSPFNLEEELRMWKKKRWGERGGTHGAGALPLAGGDGAGYVHSYPGSPLTEGGAVPYARTGTSTTTAVSHPPACRSMCNMHIASREGATPPTEPPNRMYAFGQLTDPRSSVPLRPTPLPSSVAWARRDGGGDGENQKKKNSENRSVASVVTTSKTATSSIDRTTASVLSIGGDSGAASRLFIASPSEEKGTTGCSIRPPHHRGGGNAHGASREAVRTEIPLRCASTAASETAPDRTRATAPLGMVPPSLPSSAVEWEKKMAVMLSHLEKAGMREEEAFVGRRDTQTRKGMASPVEADVVRPLPATTSHATVVYDPAKVKEQVQADAELQRWLVKVRQVTARQVESACPVLVQASSRPGLPRPTSEVILPNVVEAIASSLDPLEKILSVTPPDASTVVDHGPPREANRPARVSPLLPSTPAAVEVPLVDLSCHSVVDRTLPSRKISPLLPGESTVAVPIASLFYCPSTFSSGRGSNTEGIEEKREGGGHSTRSPTMPRLHRSGNGCCLVSDEACVCPEEKRKAGVNPLLDSFLPTPKWRSETERKRGGGEEEKEEANARRSENDWDDLDKYAPERFGGMAGPVRSRSPEVDVWASKRCGNMAFSSTLPLSTHPCNILEKLEMAGETEDKVFGYHRPQTADASLLGSNEKLLHSKAERKKGSSRVSYPSSYASSKKSKNGTEGSEGSRGLGKEGSSAACLQCSSFSASPSHEKNLSRMDHKSGAKEENACDSESEAVLRDAVLPERFLPILAVSATTPASSLVPAHSSVYARGEPMTCISSGSNKKEEEAKLCRESRTEECFPDPQKHSQKCPASSDVSLSCPSSQPLSFFFCGSDFQPRWLKGDMTEEESAMLQYHTTKSKDAYAELYDRFGTYLDGTEEGLWSLWNALGGKSGWRETLRPAPLSLLLSKESIIKVRFRVHDQKLSFLGGWAISLDEVTDFFSVILSRLPHLELMELFDCPTTPFHWEIVHEVLHPFPSLRHVYFLYTAWSSEDVLHLCKLCPTIGQHKIRSDTSIRVLQGMRLNDVIEQSNGRLLIGK